MAKAIGVIPARYGSMRFEGKPLKPILDRPLLQWVIEGASQAKSLSEIVVATDDQRICDLAEKCGVRGVMTSPELPSGSDRVWAAIKDESWDVVINIQGDEPLVQGEELDQLVGAFSDDSIQMATLGKAFSSEEEVKNPTTAKIVTNRHLEALYFSRLPVPFGRQGFTPDSDGGVLKHIGLYGYRKEFLGAFCDQPPVFMEKMEGLEQLRALWLGAKIKVILTESDSWGVDTPEDVVRVERLLSARR